MGLEKNEWDEHPLNKHHRALLETIPKSWMLRECSVYKDEYKGCSSMRGKLNSYYINGQVSGCDDWKNNYEDCQMWTKNADESAAKRVIAREEKRIFDRLKGHYLNDVWESRTSEERPPADWNKPLPPHLADAAEDSYLKQYKDSLEDDGDNKKMTLQVRKATSSLSSSTEGCTIL